VRRLGGLGQVTKDTCEECQFFGKNACSYNVTDPNRAKCDEFYRRRDSKKERPPEHKACGVAEEGLFEAIYHDSKPAFLVKTHDGFKVFDSVTNQGHKVVPLEQGEFPYTPYGYYEHTIPNRDDLYWRTRNEVDTFVDVDPIWKDYGAACVLLSYQQEKLLTVPYPFLLGDNESGKSSFLGVLGALLYRPLLAVALPAADIYGYLGVSDSPGVILEDEAQGLDKDFEKVKIYKSGYSQGATAPRTLMLQHGRKIEYYRCFGLKVFAAEKMPSVKGFNERCVPISMFHGEPKKAWTERDLEDMKRIYELRNALLKWRLASRLEWSLPEPDLPFKGRMRELWKPILQVTHGLPVYETLLNFAAKQAEERLTGKQNTLEGHIVKVVAELYQKDRPIPFTDTWDALVVDLEAKLDDKRPNKMDSPEFGEVTKQRVGYRLHEVLGGNKRSYRSKESFTKAYDFNDEKLKRVIRSYGFNIVSKCLSFPTSEGVSTAETMEKDRENNVEKPLDTPLELGKLGHTDTSSPEPSRDLTAPTMKNENNPKSETNIDNILGWLRLEFQSGHGNQVLSIVPLELTTRGTCPLCQKRDVNLVWQIQFLDESRVDACCIDCGGRVQDLVREFEESAS
jgi:hypothetical protein